MPNNTQTHFNGVASPTQKGSGMLKLSIITFFAVVLTAGGTYWLSRDSAEQKAILQNVQTTVQDAVKDTPLVPLVENVIDYIHAKPLPATVTKPSTTPGTLSGQNIHAQMSPPLGNKQSSTVTQNNTVTNKAQNNEQGTKPQNTTPATTNTTIINAPNGMVSLTPPTVQVGSIGSSTKDSLNDSAKKQQGEHEKNNKSTEHSPQNAQGSAQLQIVPSQEQKPATPTLAKVEEDEYVPLPFVDDVATWLVKRYSPKSGTNFSLGLINSRYGHDMQALMPQGEQDVYGSRAELLRYAFNAPMLKALYGLYADRFVKAMNVAAQKEVKAGKKIIPAKLLSAYATEFQILGDTLRAIGATTEFGEHMKNYETAAQKVLQVHKEITEAIHDLNTAKEKGENTKAFALRVTGLNAEYQRSIHERNLKKESLVSSIRQHISKHNRMDNDSILFVAKWLERRIATGVSDISTINNARIAGELLQDLSVKLSQSEKNTNVKAVNNKKNEG